MEDKRQVSLSETFHTSSGLFLIPIYAIGA